jgi:hypothetical protein
MGKSNAEKRRTHKFAQASPATRNFVQHAQWQHHRLLERLINDPFAPNHLDRVADGDPVLREALRKAGVTGLTREQLWEERDEYVARLEAGEEPYSSRLIRSGWLDDDGQMIDSQTGEVIAFVPVCSAN